MKAAVGDRIVTASGVVGGATRDGVVVACPHGDGSPPYRVRWSDTGDETLVYPGTDTFIDHSEPVFAPDDARGAASRTVTWQVEITLNEAAGSTTAEATVRGMPEIRAVGHARKAPDDAEVPEIGDEIAAARALRRLADHLLAVAERDVSAAVGHHAHVHA
ncbi:dsRBD fold-containing protein [Myceligenerans crystallogenes]|uniref:DUF1918 domain-containing protein n=1 Tax=Myceligenerans crystallogenes TaxID=316335 RepID=A0ABN2N5G3_9MICO